MSSKQTFDLMIVAAGNGTRMGDATLPKILTKINGYPNLWNTLDKWRSIPGKGKTYIVVNNRNGDWIEHSIKEYFLHLQQKNQHLTNDFLTEEKNNIEIVKIESGRGDGHAVMEAARHLPLSSFFFIVWGDAYFTSWNIFTDCIDEYRRRKDMDYPMYVPVINEKNPYVTFIVDEKMECIAADFSKRGENHPSGFHDQCVFLCKRSTICELLSVMHNTYLKNGRYVTDSGELTFLYLIHFLHNVSNPAKAIITDSPVLSYNTVGEVKAIEKALLG